MLPGRWGDAGTPLNTAVPRGVGGTSMLAMGCAVCPPPWWGLLCPHTLPWAPRAPRAPCAYHGLRGPDGPHPPRAPCPPILPMPPFLPVSPVPGPGFQLHPSTPSPPRGHPSSWSDLPTQRCYRGRRPCPVPELRACGDSPSERCTRAPAGLPSGLRSSLPASPGLWGHSPPRCFPTPEPCPSPPAPPSGMLRPGGACAWRPGSTAHPEERSASL